MPAAKVQQVSRRQCASFFLLNYYSYKFCIASVRGLGALITGGGASERYQKIMCKCFMGRTILRENGLDMMSTFLALALFGVRKNGKDWVRYGWLLGSERLEL